MNLAIRRARPTNFLTRRRSNQNPMLRTVSTQKTSMTTVMKMEMAPVSGMVQLQGLAMIIMEMTRATALVGMKVV